ncbi:HIT family protein [Sulfurimonas sp. HSL1-6]|uniref:HIT family protein n=1 Tax=Thiomicrolovo immobilis TaxID=3131935 RepID=UPI0031F77F60
MKCIFCHLPENTIVDGNDLACAFYDKYPVTQLHMLIIPKRHVADYFELTQEEIAAMHDLLLRQKARLLRLDGTITGFNVGINVGADAGQTVFHVHMHLIPRRRGDMNDPKGGVRGVIPQKRKY